MSDGPALTRILDAVRHQIEIDGPGSVTVEAATELARTALRRLPESQLADLDPSGFAGRLVRGARLLAERDNGVRIAISPPDEDHVGGSLLQLASADRPFLLSTVRDELQRSELRVVRQLHPIVGAERDADGRLLSVRPARGALHRETLLHLILDRTLDDDEATALTDRLTRAVADVHAVTDDFPVMQGLLSAHAKHAVATSARLRATAGPVADTAPDPADLDEVADLIGWLLDDHVVLLGTRRYRMVDAAATPIAESAAPATGLEVIAGSGAGLLRDESASRYVEPILFEAMAGSLADSIRDLSPVVWSRTARRSTVQRSVRMEHIAFAEHGPDGRPIGILRVLALFTRRGEDAPAEATPVLRRKLAEIVELEDVVPGSHDELMLTDLFQALQKDDLFAADVEQLRTLLLGLLDAEDHRETRALLRLDEATRTISVYVAVPRDTYSPRLRDRVRDHLRRRFDAERIDVAVSLGDRNEALARYLLTLEHDLPEIDLVTIEEEIRQLARSWADELTALLTVRDGSVEAARLIGTIARRLPRSYRDTVDPETATYDLRLIDRALRDRRPLAVEWRPSEDPARWRLHVVTRGTPLELSTFLPVLESLGLTVVEELPHRLLGPDELRLHDFGVRVEPRVADGLTDPAVREAAADTIAAAWRGHADVDPLNRLVLVAGLTWRDVAVLRAYRRYRQQLGTPYTPTYVDQTLVEHATAAAALTGRFRARFDPSLSAATDDPRHERAAALATADAAFDDAMAAVSRLDADRILRGIGTLIDATTRTNAFREDAVADDTGEPYLALKLDPARIPDVPAPVPHREVFVSSTRVEGVHLRGGAVARGGLRWSDRRDDVRTEVLGLVKAQILKNALIVPTGAKGGFVLARPPADPDELRAEVQRQYVTYIRALLDVTDTLRSDDDGDRVVPPPGVVRHDGDDPYLVVAADRGTATFSDTANAVAERYGFWLGDAFASGGSRGYDHKALGVTAKGAWRAVARHFRELDLDVQQDPLTVAGVGDMSGDVFSNGLLRSRTVRLVAAFDHRHIFVDPDPDPDRSFDERQRLADLPRSSWDDYDRDVLSPGGFVVARDVRTVALSPEARTCLRVEEESLTPPELIRAILGAPVDLLWAGGIGTYIKASDERHDDVGDRANDEVRVDATVVRARVIGEGANLFVTQRARIELAKRGARLDQDAVHNAAGVATSDAEVNLKILLDLAITAGELTPDERDEVLVDLADDVVGMVLDAVDRQVAALSSEVARGARDVGALEAFICRLEATGELDREVEVLPSTEELEARAEAGGSLTRPELATLLAWAKRELKEALLASDAPEDPVLADAVAEPFPARVVERFGHLLPRHRLRRELIATAAANGIVDRLGITFAGALAAETGASLPMVARAVRIATHLVEASRWWDAIETLAETHDPSRVRELTDAVDELVADLTSTLLRDPMLHSDPLALRDRDAAVTQRLMAKGFDIGSVAQRHARRAHARWLIDDLVDPDLARLLACAPDLSAVPDVSAIVAEDPARRDPVVVADIGFRLAEQLGIDRLTIHLAKHPVGDGWERRQHGGMQRDLRRLRREATTAAIDEMGGRDLDADAAVEAFLGSRQVEIGRAAAMVTEATRERPNLNAIAVALRVIHDAIRP